VWQNECNFIDLKQFNLWGTKLKLKQICPFFFCQTSELRGEVAGACTIHTIV
jgi:hypothetical protein